MSSSAEALGDQIADAAELFVDIDPNNIGDDISDIIDNIDGPVFVGTLGDDIIYGTRKSDTIFADPTVLDDVGGDDVVYAGKGDDLVYTFGGNDIVYGAGGKDTIQTADGDDVVDAGKGDDDVQSGRGQDLVMGGKGDDSLRGGEDDDHLLGGPGDDRVIGGSDDDTLEDGTGRDRLEGRTGDDLHLLADDGEKDRIEFRADDVGNGVDTIRGFDTADTAQGGDFIDLRDIEGARFEVVQLCDEALIYAITAGVPEPTLMAVVEDVAVADLLDGNVRIAKDSTIEEAEVDLTLLIANALAAREQAEAVEAVGSAASIDGPESSIADHSSVFPAPTFDSTAAGCEGAIA